MGNYRDIIADPSVPIKKLADRIAYLEKRNRVVGTGSGGFAIGDLKWSALSTVSVGWIRCDGSALLSSTPYQELRAALLADGSKYGADGSGNPLLPKSAGRTLIDNGTADATGATAHALGARGGEETHLLTSSEAAQKAVSTGNDSPDHTHVVIRTRVTVNFGTQTVLRVTAEGTADQSGNNSTTGASARHTHSIAGSNAASGHNNMQPFVSATLFIKT